ncbi:MAG TPA: TlpA disulfide reductase family protein [Lacipirellulaceae bacterium]|nr:TlpA disulfide reductase family protein [Lacipirellulaceae bacterium]
MNTTVLRLTLILCCCATSIVIRRTVAAAHSAIGTGRANISAPAKIPQVWLSKQDQSLCRVRVGDDFPAIVLPQIGVPREAKLSTMYGKRATVVVFWRSDRYMARQELVDLGPEVIDRFGKSGVSVVGIAVKESQADADATLKKANATFVNLLDSNGDAFAEVGSERLPRTYLLDSHGKILWFDIEYSLATRRELKQALQVVTAESATRTVK